MKKRIIILLFICVLTPTFLKSTLLNAGHPAERAIARQVAEDNLTADQLKERIEFLKKIGASAQEERPGSLLFMAKKSQLRASENLERFHDLLRQKPSEAKTEAEKVLEESFLLREIINYTPLPMLVTLLQKSGDKWIDVEPKKEFEIPAHNKASVNFPFTASNEIKVSVDLAPITNRFIPYPQAFLVDSFDTITYPIISKHFNLGIEQNQKTKVIEAFEPDFLFDLSLAR